MTVLTASRPQPSGCPEMDYARKLTASAVHAPDHYIDVITTAAALTWRLDDFESAPRILALGEQHSGKSTVLKVASCLARSAGPPTAVLAMTAPSYVSAFRMNAHFTPVIDEMNQLFGVTGSNGQFSKFYAYLNQGYLRDTGWAQFQENKDTVKIPLFCIAFLAGRGLACPADLRDRSVVLRMEGAPEDVEVADFSDPEVKAAFRHAKKCLASWASELPPLSIASARGLHPKLAHRRMEVWGPLFALSLKAGGDWTDRILVAFERIELNSVVPVHPPEVQVMLDYLAFSELGEGAARESVASGEFAAWACAREHGAYLSMRPGQFRQFAVAHLGPTAPYYDPSGTRRGWSGMVHQLNLGNARRALAAIEARRQQPEARKTEWEDF